jgi:hypothetical protein
MALAVASTSSVVGGTTLPAPTGIQTGDLLVAICYRGNTSNTVTISGFTVNHSFAGVTTTGLRQSYTLLYKVALLADESTPNYTVSGSGVHTMLRITGWGGNTNNPIWAKSDVLGSLAGGGTQTTSVDIERPNQGIAIIAAGSRVDDTFVGPMTILNQGITSTSGDLTWTELVDGFWEDNDADVFGVAYGTFSASDNITAWEYEYDRGNSFTDSNSRQIASLTVILEPRNETGTSALHLAEPIFFPNATNLGSTGTADLLETEPIFFDTTSSVTNKKVFTDQQKGTKTWTNQQRYE